MPNQLQPIAKAEMLIRKPVTEVFEAFVNPAVTSQFWFSKGSGRLETGKQVQWDWEMYNFSVTVNVKAIVPNARILVEWSAYGAPTPIEWIFKPRADGTTFVTVTNKDFSGSEAGRRNARWTLPKDLPLSSRAQKFFLSTTSN